MSIDYKDLEVIKDKPSFKTSNEKFVLTQECETVIRSPEYKLLGFLNNYSYSYSYYYLVKSTLYGTEIGRVYLENIRHGVFQENIPFMYFHTDNIIYKVDENLNILWEIETDDYIRAITMDTAGNLFVVYMNSRSIHKYLPDGKLLVSMTGSDTIANKCRIFKTYIDKGRMYMYVIGTVYGTYEVEYIPKKLYYNFITEDGDIIINEESVPILLSVYNKEVTDTDNTYAETFIDKYELRNGTRLERKILCKDYGIKADDVHYYFNSIFVKDDYIYINANHYIQKVNTDMIPIWRYNLGYNNITNNYNRLANIEYDDNDYSEHIYFSEDMFETNGHSIGKISVDGDLIWKVGFDRSYEDAEFTMCSYKDSIYTCTKVNIEMVDSYNLSLDNSNTLFKTRGGKLITVVRNNEDEMYSSAYYSAVGLLCSVVKEGVYEYLNSTMMIDNDNYIMVDDSHPLLLTTVNKHYYDEENYDYKILLSSTIERELRQTTILKSLKNMRLLTMQGSNIATKYPYNVEPNLDGLYEYNNILCADSHLLYNDIITKKRGKYIITKKHGGRLIKKKKSFYKYVVRKFRDVDIIVEFFKQSGIKDTLIPKYSEKLIHHTTHMIEDMQEAFTPVLYDIGAVKKFDYTYDGDVYPIRYNRTQIYMCKNIPYIKKKQTADGSIYIDSMTNLVNNEIIKPFILFIDGKAIKWSNITVVKDWSYSFLIINNIDYTIDSKYDISSILLPCSIRYGEDDNILSGDFYRFLFDSTGRYTDDFSKSNMRIEILNTNILSNTIYHNSNTKYFEVPTKDGQHSSHKNILVFENGLFYPNSRLYIQSYSNSKFSYNRTNDSTIKVFYYDKANTSKNHLLKIPNQLQVNHDIKENIMDNSKNEYLNNFKVRFDYRYSNKRSYSDNLSRAVKYILNYDTSLFNKYYLDKSNVRCYCYTGKQILDIASNNEGFMCLARQRRFCLDDYIIVFKNNELYEYYREIEYKANMFRVPIFDHVSEDDVIEIIHYKNVNNDFYETYLSTLTPEEEQRLLDMATVGYGKIGLARLYGDNIFRKYLEQPDYVIDGVDYRNYLSKYLRYNNFLIFANSKSDSYIYEDFNIENNKQYPVEFNYKNNYEGDRYVSTDVVLEDKYYKFKKVNFTSKRQFHHMYYNILEPSNRFELDPTFRFSQNKDQYMIFINNRKVNFDNFKLLNMNDIDDLKYITIELENELNVGDIIDIFYVPDAYDEIILTNYELNEYGVINLDLGVLQYPFDKDLYLVFMDGKKIANSHIQNISNNKIRITDYTIDDLNTSHNITICRYIQPDRILKEVFSYNDQWSNAIDSLKDNDFKKLFVTIRGLS